MSSFHMLILILSDYSKLVGEKTRESCRENENIKKKKKKRKRERRCGSRRRRVQWGTHPEWVETVEQARVFTDLTDCVFTVQEARVLWSRRSTWIEGKPWLLTSVSNTFSSSSTFFFGWVFKTTWVLTVYSQVMDWAGVCRWRLSFWGCSTDFNWVWFKSLQTCRFYLICVWSIQFV